MAQQTPGGQGLHIVEDSQSHSDTSNLVGLLWTSDQPDAETSTEQQTTMPLVGFKPTNPSKRAAADTNLRPPGNWDRHLEVLLSRNWKQSGNVTIILV